MLNRSKFKLISYIIHKEIIFYRSINRNEKIFGFSIIKTLNIDKILNILKNCISHGLLNYFAIQIDPYEDFNQLIILNFQDHDKNNIIKVFSILYHRLKENLENFQFLYDEDLEKYFFNIGFPGNDPNIIIFEDEDYLVLESNPDFFRLKFYEIKVKNIQKKFFISDLIHLLKNSKINGRIIFNFKFTLRDALVFSAYIISINENRNLKDHINQFFKKDLIDVIKIRSSLFPNLIWRREITDTVYKYTEKINFNLIKHNQEKFNEEIEIRNELINEINKLELHYIKINSNLYLIENDFIILIVINLNLKYIIKFVKKYYNKYEILILIKNLNDYNNINLKTKLNSLRKLKICYAENFFDSKYVNDYLKIN
jgi:hypothetical protein